MPISLNIAERLQLLQQQLDAGQMYIDTAKRLLQDTFADPDFLLEEHQNPVARKILHQTKQPALYTVHPDYNGEVTETPAEPKLLPAVSKPPKKKRAKRRTTEQMAQVAAEKVKATNSRGQGMALRNLLLEYAKSNKKVESKAFREYVASQGMEVPGQAIHVLLSELTRKNLIKRSAVGVYTASQSQLANLRGLTTDSVSP